ncbi:MAG: hypothetical protein AAGH46_04430, partial [Bacteroidota bacterium]
FDIVVDADLSAEYIKLDLNSNLDRVYTDSYYTIGSIEPNSIEPVTIGDDGNDQYSNIIPRSGIITLKMPVGDINLNFSIQIKNNSGRPDHKIAVRIKTRKPTISSISIQPRIGLATTNKLLLDYNSNLDISIRIQGQGFYVKPEIEFQSYELKVNQFTATEIRGELKIDKAKLRDLLLGSSKMVLRDKNNDWRIEQDITVEANKPTIEAPITSIQYYAKTSQVKLTLRTTNTSPNVRVFTECPDANPCHVEIKNEGFSASQLDGNLQSTIGIGLPDNVDRTRVLVYIKNGDDKTSAKLPVTIEPSTATAQVIPKNPEYPLIEGTPTEVEFISTNGDFEIINVAAYQLKIEGVDSKINVNSSKVSSKKITANVEVPKSINGVSRKFVLNNGAQSWSGEIGQVYPIPSLINSSENYLRSLEYVLKYDKTSPKAEIFSEQKGIKVLDKDISDGIGTIKIETSFENDTVKLITKINSATVKTELLKVDKWLIPSSYFKFEGVDFFKRNRLNYLAVTKKERKFKIEQISSFVSRESPQVIKFQLLDNENNQLDTANLQFKETETEEILLDRFDGGDRFRLIGTSIDNQRKVYNGFLKRTFWESLTFDVGLSGVRYLLDDPNKNFEERVMLDSTLQKTDRFRILKGINLGVFYHFENKTPRKKRLFGFGLYANFIEDEDGADIDSSFGLGLMLAETILIGVDFGDKNNAITIGASANLIDFVKLLADSEE